MNAAEAKSIHQTMDLDVIDLSRVKLDPIWAGALPAQGARRFRVIGLCQVDEVVIVATSNPRIATVRRFVEAQLKEPFRLVQVDDAAIRRVLARVYPRPTSLNQTAQERESCENVEVCDDLLRAAFLRGASDVHLVPNETTVQSRFRVDGNLEDYRSFPAEQHGGLASRIKVLAGMNIAEKRKPQDGRFSIKDPSTQTLTDIRAATIPTRFGERITLRLLSPMQSTPELADLGMDHTELVLFTQAITSANGLVLLTGPTGCGKSTTLYTAIMQLLRTRGGNIITVEDPIEHEIPGATQVEVDAAGKVSFPQALRSILRHDPDVIMLGEIRDTETADLAIKASLTGHLVFSTLHTNTAAGVVTRLIDMGVEPYLIAATLRLAAAQRLVRKLCPCCKFATTLSAANASQFGRPELAGLEVYEGKGCVYCAGKGFAGRAALFEMLPGDGKVSDLISKGVTEADLLKHMQESGHPRLINDAIDKVLAGTTTAYQALTVLAKG